MGGRAAADWDRAWRLEQRAAPALCARVPTFAPATPAAPTGGRLTRWRTAGRSAPSRLLGSGGGEGRGAGRFARVAPSPQPAGWLGSERLARRPPPLPPPAPWALPLSAPAHSTPRFLRTRSYSRLWISTPKWTPGKGGRDASKEKGKWERENCVLQRPCLQCIFIPGHRLAGQVFAPLGSVDPSQALPGAHKETNRAHVSNPSATGDVKHSGEAAGCPPPSQ